MFGFGQKRTSQSGKPTDATIQKSIDFLEVARRFPGVIPKSEVKVSMKALDIAAQVGGLYSPEMFQALLIEKHSIEKDFPAGWSSADALSRWYALGLICLTHCSMTTNWSDALTVEVGLQVYDACVETLWIKWSMPEAVKERVQRFMQENISGIMSSLRTIVDGRTKDVWFERYARRIKGGNPPWDVRQSGQSSLLENQSSPERVSTDLLLSRDLAWLFKDKADSIMKLVSQTASSVTLDAPSTAQQSAQGSQRTPADRIWPSGLPIVKTTEFLEVAERFPDLIPRSGAKVADLALEIASGLALRFSFSRFEQILLREHSIEKGFLQPWNGVDALSRWYALGLICLTHCSMTPTWSDALTADVGIRVYDAASDFIWIFWCLPDAVKERILRFMVPNIQNITRSLRGIVDEQSTAEWFRRYAVEMKGGNPQWEPLRSQEPKPWEVKVWGWLSADLALNDFLLAQYTDSSEHILKLVSGTTQSVKISGMLSTAHSEKDPMPMPTTPSEGQIAELYEAWKKGTLLEALQERDRNGAD